MKRTILFTTSLILSLNTFSAEWNYDNEKNWGKISEICEKGNMQSPIDIQSNFSVLKMPQLEFSYDTVTLKVINNGHALQLDNDKDNHFTISGKDYKLLQFHVHTPSEYTIEGKQFPLEIHFVHQDSEGALGVIGVMADVGKANAEINKILEIAPKKEGAEAKDDVIDLVKLLPEDQQYYRLMGSLTTPPCREGVHWFMMRSSVEISQEQLQQFQSILSHNARSLQSQNNRLIISEK